jgi:hypothetical protein
MRIRDPGWKKFGYGIRNGKKVGSGINNPDPQQWGGRGGEVTYPAPGVVDPA